jgi:hypothetical protein
LLKVTNLMQNYVFFFAVQPLDHQYSDERV